MLVMEVCMLDCFVTTMYSNALDMKGRIKIELIGSLSKETFLKYRPQVTSKTLEFYKSWNAFPPRWSIDMTKNCLGEFCEAMTEMAAKLKMLI